MNEIAFVTRAKALLLASTANTRLSDDAAVFCNPSYSPVLPVSASCAFIRLKNMCFTWGLCFGCASSASHSSIRYGHNRVRYQAVLLCNKTLVVNESLLSFPLFKLYARSIVFIITVNVKYASAVFLNWETLKFYERVISNGVGVIEKKNFFFTSQQFAQA